MLIILVVKVDLALRFVRLGLFLERAKSFIQCTQVREL
jgi:hypothetical protein